MDDLRAALECATMQTSPPEVEAPAPRSVRHWQGLHGAAGSLELANLAAASRRLFVCVAADAEGAVRAREEIGCFAPDDLPVHALPEWETLPYDHFSPHQDIVSERLATLHELPRLHHGVLVVTAAILVQRLAPVRFVQEQSLVVEVGQTLDLAAERERLARAGYRAVSTVSERGEFAVRGSLLDIFPMGAPNPVRVDLFDDEVDSLRTFDADSQRTIAEADAVRVLPALEVPLDAAGIARFRAKWHTTFDVDVRRCQIYQEVSEGVASQGVEYYLPLFFEATSVLTDHLPEDAVLVVEDDTDAAVAHHLADVEARYESLRHDIERPILAPRELCLTSAEMRQRIAPFARICLDKTGERRRGRVAFASRELPELTANHRARDPLRSLRAFVGNASARIALTAESAGRRAHLDDLLRRAGIVADEIDDLRDFLGGADARADSSRPALAVAPLERGLWHGDVAIVTETEILGHRHESAAEANRRAGVDPDAVIRHMTELNIGAPVVHLDHGVGRYRGLVTLTIDGYPMEFLCLEYAEEAKVYVPVTALHLVSRYTGASEENAPLHRLGSDQWDKAKRRAAERVHDVAAELLDIYARREASESFAFGAPGDDYQRFCEQFPFDATPDQATAIDAVIDDLTSRRATDRLICGDVGFGKTEVAMRAAFLAVQSGRQVAVLTPTTLLAQQHFETFSDRFADWPVRVGAVSRLRADKEVKALAEELANGRLDIVIGTHRLLSAQFRFRNLGLIVIDEEHRFGVRQKERLKSLRAEADVLTLTATPIPRTLNIAMSGLRDLSIIATPPARRLAIKTFVMRRSRSLVTEAVSRELSRGGQVFYVHNEIRSIERVAAEIKELAPQARIGVGHGQMPKRDLERVMTDFYHRRVNVLVCTTIVENGLDIPNANTIVIERADRFGLAQLHQLRGRVGRSHRQAYAYLLTPDPREMTPDARKRLDAIEASGELGIGFTLATHDLEIRGAGELLGDDQSGQIETIGFSLYMDMLERAVKAIRSGTTPNLTEPLDTSHDVNLHVPALIPDDYLPDVHMRLIMYKRISNAATVEALDQLKIEMIDRFGLLPDPLRNLFRTTALKLAAGAIGVARIDVGSGGGRLEFAPEPRADALALVRLVQAEPGTYQLQGGARSESTSRLRMSRSLEETEKRFQFVEQLVERLTPKGDEAPPGAATTDAETARWGARAAGA